MPPNARTRQYSGRPEVHGSAIGTGDAGVISALLDHTTAFPARKVWLVESSNWYRAAPRTGFQANDGVLTNDALAGAASPSRSSNACSPVGTVSASDLAEEPVAAGTAAAAATTIASARAPRLCWSSARSA